jgi:type IX secretion system PorP/SprF family membrane protein
MKSKIIFFILGFVMNIQAQDNYYSLFTAAPLYTNPANTGLNNCDWRVNLNMRNEWLNVGSGTIYMTGAVSGDMAIGRSKNSFRNFAGVGILFNQSKAGSLRYNQSDIALSGAYHLVMGKRHNSVLSFGIQGGIFITSFDGSKLLFTEDIDPNTHIPTYTSMPSQTVIVPDANFGMLFSSKVNDVLKFNIGSSIYHLPQFKYEFAGASNNFKHLKYIGQIGSSIKIKKIEIQPSLYWSVQNSVVQGFYGTNVKYYFQEKTKADKKNIAISAGMWYRNIGAVTTALKYEFNSLQVGIAYDINLSDLPTDKRWVGAPELSLTYTGCLKNKKGRMDCFIP